MSIGEIKKLKLGISWGKNKLLDAKEMETIYLMPQTILNLIISIFLIYISTWRAFLLTS